MINFENCLMFFVNVNHNSNMVSKPTMGIIISKIGLSAGLKKEQI